MFKKLSEEIKAFQDKLAERSYASSKERLARLILCLGESGIELSRAELSEMAGVSSKTAIRTLSEFEERGIISVENRKIQICDKNHLLRMIESSSLNLDGNVII